MAGIVPSDLYIERDREVVRPISCPGYPNDDRDDTEYRAPCCWKNSALYGQRYCPYYIGIATAYDLTKRAGHPSVVAADAERDGKSHRAVTVLCHLARSKDTPPGC